MEWLWNDAREGTEDPGNLAKDPWLEISEAERQMVDEVARNGAAALAEYQRGLVSKDSPFDRFLSSYLTSGVAESSLVDGFGKEEFEGLQIFMGRGNCTLCHNGPNFTDQQFHNIGLSYREEIDAISLPIGRAGALRKVAGSALNCLGGLPNVASKSEGRAAGLLGSESCLELQYADYDNLEFVGAFKTPSLRNVGATGPYMHDGRFATLEEVIEHYSALPGKPAIGHREESLRPLNLDLTERRHLVAFLKSLTGTIVDTGVQAVVAQPL
jgi:cytochrome c peroxidase